MIDEDDDLTHSHHENEDQGISDFFGCQIRTELPPAGLVEKYDLCFVFKTDAKKAAVYAFAESDDVNDDADSNRLSSLISPAASRMLLNIVQILGKRCLYIYHDSREEKLFVLLRSSLGAMKNRAEKEGAMLFLMDRKRLQEAGYDITRKNPFIEPIFVPHSPSSSHINPYTHIYLRYKQDLEQQNMYYCPDGYPHPIGKTARIKLLLQDLQLDWERGVNMNEEGEIENFRRATRKGLNPHSLDSLVHDGTMLSYYPVLDEDSLDGFSVMWWSAWLPRCDWSQSNRSTALTTGIKEFFGERIAVYFWFLDNVLNFFLPPAVFGLLLEGLYMLNYFTQRSYYLEATLLVAITPGYSLFITVWVIIWSVRLFEGQQLLATLLNLNNCLAGLWQKSTENDCVRPEFYGSTVQSCVDGRETLRFSGWRRFFHVFLSALATASVLILSLICTTGIFYGRSALNEKVSELGGIRSQWVMSVGLGFQVVFFNWFFNSIAAELTNFENHRYEKSYNESLVGKMFVFGYINSLASCYYLAFAAPYSPSYVTSSNSGDVLKPSFDCLFNGRYVSNDCSLPLTINILCILTCQLFVHNLWHNAIPYLVYQWREWRKRRNARARQSLFAFNWQSCCTMSGLTSCACCECARRNCSIDWRWWFCLGCCSNSDPARDADRSSRRYSVPNSGGGGGGRATIDRSSRNLRAMSTRSAYSSMRGTDEHKQSMDLSDIYTTSGRAANNNNRTTENASRAGLLSPAHRRRQSSPRGNAPTQTQRSSDCREVCDNSISMDLQYPPLNQRRDIPLKYVTVPITCSASFCIALPASCFLVVLGIWAEYRGFAFNLLHIHQRSMHLEAAEIDCGPFILNLIVHCVVLTNAALLVLHAEQFSHFLLVYKLCLFIGVALFCYGCQYLLNRCRRSPPKEVLIQRMRCEFFNEKFFEQVPDSPTAARVEIL
eukprot:gene22747-31035_t